MEDSTSTKRKFVTMTRINFQRHDDLSIYKLVAQSKMVQTKITKYYQPIYRKQKQTKPRSWSESSSSEDGKHHMWF